MSFLPTNGFRVVIKRLPGLEFYAQRFQTPDASITVVEQATPFMQLKLPGDKMMYGPLVVTFKVDEYLKNYEAIRDWMSAVSRERSWSDYDKLRRSEEGIVSEMTLAILDSKTNVGVEFAFRDVFPISLGSLQFDSTQTDVIYSTVDVTFEHDGYEVRRRG